MHHLLPNHTGSLRIAAISDIHSNWSGLEACLDYLDKVEQPDAVLLLGDHLTDLSSPERTMDLLRGVRDTTPSFFLSGNREERLLAHYRRYAHADLGAQEPSSASGSFVYTAACLSRESWNWLETMPDQAVIKIGNAPPLTVCHGSLQNSRDELWTGTPELEETWDLMETDILLHGHTHTYEVITNGSKRIVGVGQVSFNTVLENWTEEKIRSYLAKPSPGEATVHAGITVLDWSPSDEDYQIRSVDVPYDPFEIIDEVLNSELNRLAPWWIQGILRELVTGDKYVLRMIRQAQGHARRRTSGEVGHLTEEDFGQAYRRITGYNSVD